MSVRRDLVIEAGSTERWSFTWRQPPLAATPEVPGIPHDLNSASARMQIRTKPNRTGSVLLELSDHTGNGIILGGTNGFVIIQLTPEQTASLRVRRAFYDLFITLADGEVHKVMSGRIKVEPNVTAPSTGIATAENPEGITA